MRTSNNQITKKDLMSIYIRSLSLEYSWNYERQQHMGYCFAMLPAIKRIYEKREAQIEAARRHMEFFNTTPMYPLPSWGYPLPWRRAMPIMPTLTPPPSTV